MVVLGVILDEQQNRRPSRNSDGTGYELFASRSLTLPAKTGTEVNFGCTLVAPPGCLLVFHPPDHLAAGGVTVSSADCRDQRVSKVTMWNGGDGELEVVRDDLLVRFHLVTTRTPELAFWDTDKRSSVATLETMMMPRRPIDVMARPSGKWA
jgi:hypothetical protein